MLTEQELAYIDRNKLIEKLRNDRAGTNSEYHRGYNACIDELLDELEEGRFDANSLQDTIQQLRKERELLIFEKEQVLTLLKDNGTTEQA